METFEKENLLIEGKTKRVFGLKNDSKLVFVESKDRITAGDGLKAHNLEGKAKLSTQTNCAVFEFLRAAGVPTHFVSRVLSDEKSFIALKCEMIPIEWVSRRVATGSYLKRNPNVSEGFRFFPPKLETFFKDDANHDPFWSEESLIGAKMTIGGITIDRKRVKQMFSISRLVFELLERVWQTVDHSLIDMKIEFGVTADGAIVVADVIDNDSWRLWPKGEKRLMLDKQIYRNMEEKSIDSKALQTVKESFEVVAQRTHQIFSQLLPSIGGESGAISPTVAIIVGSTSDLSHAEKIRSALRDKFGVNDVSIDVTSAHKATQNTLDVVSRLTQYRELKVIIACAGLSNGLGPVVAANTAIPVINCPPEESLEALKVDIWSSLRMPSGMGCSLVLNPLNAALSAALVVGVGNAMVWAKIKTLQTLTAIKF